MSENYFQTFIKEKGLSQYRVAKQTGITVATINRWVKGHHKISNHCLYRLKSVYPDFDALRVNPNLKGV